MIEVLLRRRSLRAFSLIVLFLLTAVRAEATQAADRAALPVDPPREVSVMLYVVDLVEVDASEQTFFADLMVVARWLDDTLADPGSGVRTFGRGEVWSPNLLVVNQRGASSSLADVVIVDAAGNAQLSQRLTGDFSVRLDLRDFPRDSQRLDLWIVAPPLGGEAVELVPDAGATTLRNDVFSISDWNLGEFEIVSREYRMTPDATVFPGLALTFEIERRIGYYIIQVLLPLLAVVLMAWAVFWIDPAVVATRVGVVVTTMLSLIAYRFMLGNLIPRLSYLTRLDYFMLFTTSLVVLTLFAMAASSFLKTREREDLIQKIDRTGRIAYPTLLAAITIILWVF